MEKFDYSSVLPTAPPEGTLERAMQRGAFRHQRLIYRAERYYDPLEDTTPKGVRVTCTGCGETWIAAYIPAGGCWRSGGSFGFFCGNEPVRSGESCLCPQCGSEARATHIGDFRSVLTDEYWTMTVGRYEDKLVLLGWMLQRITDKDGAVRYSADPWEAYVIEQKKIVRLMGYQRYMSTVSIFHRWEQRKQYLDCWSAAEILPFDPGILIGSTAENSALDRYIEINGDEACPVSYLRVWQKHPQIENLITQGAGRLVGEMILSETKRYSYERPKGTPQMAGINWKEKRPAAMLGLSKPEFRIMAELGLREFELSVYKRLLEKEKADCKEAMQAIRLNGCSNTLSLINSTQRGNASVMRCLRYCRRQKQDSRFLEDYWKMLRENGEELETARFPKALRQAHDRVCREINERRDREYQEKKRREIEARAKDFAAQVEKARIWAWQKDGILIRPVKDEAELINESTQQDHCVKTYASKIASGYSMIFLIRRVEQPDLAWFTLELLPDGSVNQNRGYKNCDRTPEIAQFEKEWLAWMEAKKRKKTTRKKKVAA